ncbi:torsin-2A-like [Hetaerina americana]|uniref:torsin-2A-like n=1 Tax=Hetaerina americana TaxID=62018 RepID=UPI003A7F45CF
MSPCTGGYPVQIVVFLLLFFPAISRAGVFGAFSNIFSGIHERVLDLICSHASCCKSHLQPSGWPWMQDRENLLDESLQSKLFGQHLVQDVVLRGISLHQNKTESSVLILNLLRKFNDQEKEILLSQLIKEDNPHELWNNGVEKYDGLIYEEYNRLRKLFGEALVIFMYGPPGTGKSYTSEIIAESLYKKGLNSPLVHQFGGEAIISLEHDHIKYWLKVLNWVNGNITYCPYSMFIFDKFNKVPMDIISWVMKSANNIRSRHAIFIFIMNTGDLSTMKKMNALYEAGKIREDIEMDDVYKPGFGELFSSLEDKYGLHQSIEEEIFINGKLNNPIFAPFFPLEEQHVKNCIIDHYINKGVYPSNEMIRSIQSHVKYESVGKAKFSTLGCKRIHSLVTSALSRERTFQENDEL